MLIVITSVIIIIAISYETKCRQVVLSWGESFIPEAEMTGDSFLPRLE